MIQASVNMNSTKPKPIETGASKYALPDFLKEQGNCSRFEEIALIMSQYKRILLVGEPGLGKSQVIRKLLTRNALKNKIIVETPEEVSFIIRNFLVYPDIEFLSFQKDDEIFQIISTLNKTGKEYISVFNHQMPMKWSGEQKEFVCSNFDVVVLCEENMISTYYHTH